MKPESGRSDGTRAMIGALIDAEMAGFRGLPGTLEAFRAALRVPREVRVQFSGGIEQKCWSVTRSNGDYRVIYLPSAGYFSLCVESAFGPLDIGVHGEAMACFASV